MNGAFEGCEHGKRIEFLGGSTLTCAEYGYQYAYMPQAVIFAKKAGSLYFIKALIGDELYDMEALPS